VNGAGYDDARRAYENAEPDDDARYDDCPWCEGSGSEMAEDRDGIFEAACSRCRGEGTVRS
jgi:DnaJ-class molecular chaperone